MIELDAFSSDAIPVHLLTREAIGVKGVTGDHREEPDPLPSALDTGAAEVADQRVVPGIEAPQESTARCHELSWERDDLSGELDLPELGPHPDREIPDGTGVDALATRIEARRVNPVPHQPAKAGVRRDASRTQELVRDHALRQSRNASSSCASSAAGKAPTGTRPVAAIVSRICPR